VSSGTVKDGIPWNHSSEQLSCLEQHTSTSFEKLVGCFPSLLRNERNSVCGGRGEDKSSLTRNEDTLV